MDPIIVQTESGTFTCPEHPEVGPIIVGYTGDAPPAAVSVTHNEDGNHVAVPAEEPEDDDQIPAGATATNTQDGGDGGATA